MIHSLNANFRPSYDPEKSDSFSYAYHRIFHIWVIRCQFSMALTLWLPLSPEPAFNAERILCIFPLLSPFLLLSPFPLLSPFLLWCSSCYLGHSQGACRRKAPAGKDDSLPPGVFPYVTSSSLGVMAGGWAVGIAAR